MRMVPILATILLMILLMSPEVTSQSNCYIKTNGCSVPFNLPFIYKKTFTPACVKHDVCYSCGEHYGWNQAQCDDAFKRDMYKLCENSVKGKRFLFSSVADFLKKLADKVKRCKTFGADVYHKAVQTAGHLYWEKNPPAWCNPSCAKQRGDPTKLLNV
ncbi:uncharacterized protein LOC110059110 isoform X2 [Orbicella faveolata]|nr:uncharacterized protein LOC110059110 isoform X2 [Orbicella faveolata]